MYQVAGPCKAPEPEKPCQVVVKHGIHITEPGRRRPRSMRQAPPCAYHDHAENQAHECRVEELRFGQNSGPAPQIEETRCDANGSKSTSLIAVQYILIQTGPSHLRARSYMCWIMQPCLVIGEAGAAETALLSTSLPRVTAQIKVSCMIMVGDVVAVCSNRGAYPSR